MLVRDCAPAVVSGVDVCVSRLEDEETRENVAIPAGDDALDAAAVVAAAGVAPVADVVASSRVCIAAGAVVAAPLRIMTRLCCLNTSHASAYVNFL